MQNAKLMVCGTMSSAGKSLLVAGLCRILRQDGWSVAPFKSQNMALNSYVTDEGLEMGRAQALQAQAAGERPVAAMNPILLKPTGEHASQVILNGEVAANSMSAREYFAVKTQYIPLIRRAYDTLAGTHDAVVIEGAGSPAEINLKDNDIVNMGLARMLDAPVLLVADIDRGGVFAQLYGTVKLLSEEEQERIVGMVINKFRGDPTLLEPGITQIEGLLGIPVVGTVPYIEDLYLPDEDSLSQRFTPKPKKTADGHDRIRLAVIRYPRISNFTDMDAFDQCENVEVVFVRSVEELRRACPDAVILPGSKHTIEDLLWLRRQGFDAALQTEWSGVPLFGICGGFEMLGMAVTDPGVEGSRSCEVPGLGLLPVATVLQEQKLRQQVSGKLPPIEGIFAPLSGLLVKGYEIHNGLSHLVSDQAEGRWPAITAMGCGRVCGTFYHGLFDEVKVREVFLSTVAAYHGKVRHVNGQDALSQSDYLEQQLDHLADVLRAHLDMERIYRWLGLQCQGF